MQNDAKHSRWGLIELLKSTMLIPEWRVSKSTIHRHESPRFRDGRNMHVLTHRALAELMMKAAKLALRVLLKPVKAVRVI